MPVRPGGFAVVADEVRKLSSLSGETGRNISGTTDIVSRCNYVGIFQCRALPKRNALAVYNSDQVIRDVLNDFQTITRALVRSGEQLRNNSSSIERKFPACWWISSSGPISQIQVPRARQHRVVAAASAADSGSLPAGGRAGAFDWSGLVQAGAVMPLSKNI